MRKILFSLLLLPCSLFAQTAAQLAGANDTMLQRAAQFKEALKTSEGFRSGVYIYPKRSIVDYEKNPETLAARLALLGFTDVYLGANRMITSGNLNEEKWVVAFNTQAHELGMKVHLLSLSSSKLWVDNKKMLSDCNDFINFNYAHRKNVRFDGISADLEPHIMKKGHVDRPKELIPEWHGSDNYGVGRDNDLLCRRMVEVMKKAKKELGNEGALSQAQGFFVQGRYDRGELSWGSAHQMLQYCDWLIIMAYNYRPQRIWDMAVPSLENAKNYPKSIGIAVKTSVDTYGSDGVATSLQPQGWDYMINAIRFLMEKGTEYKSFRGIDIFEFQGLEKMWNGTLDNDK
jgi:hypothetical protein